MEIDCKEISSQIRANKLDLGSFMKGFVVIESPVELDVVGVYSASGKTEMVETLDLERVPARRVGKVSGGLADLTLFSACWHGDSVTICVINKGNADAAASMTT